MADKFLNLTGLSYFWGKITSALSLKQDTLTAGTGISISNNTISDVLFNSSLNVLSSGTDLNNIKTAGYYRIPANTTNAPKTNAGTLLVEVYSGSFVAQTYLYIGNPFERYTRVCQNGTWRAWREWISSYVAGDTINTTGNMYFSGYQSSASAITFFIPLDKPMETGITSTITKCTITARGSTGGALINNVDVVSDTNYTVVITNRAPFGFVVTVTKNASLGGQSGQPIVVAGTYTVQLVASS